MAKLISILRGINVGGRRKILMADLRTLYEELGLKNPQTYIQSGNVLFDYSGRKKAAAIEEMIYKAIQKKYDFEVPVIVRTVQEITDAYHNNPFATEDTELEHLHLTFLKEIPTAEHLEKINTYDYSPDQFKIVGKEAYIYCEGKYHKSKLTNNFFEKKLKISSTTRNWKTVTKILELSNK